MKIKNLIIFLLLILSFGINIFQYNENSNFRDNIAKYTTTIKDLNKTIEEVSSKNDDLKNNLVKKDSKIELLDNKIKETFLENQNLNKKEDDLRKSIRKLLLNNKFLKKELSKYKEEKNKISNNIIIGGKSIGKKYFKNGTIQDSDELTCVYRNIVKVSQLDKSIKEIDFLKLLKSVDYKYKDGFKSFSSYNKEKEQINSHINITQLGNGYGDLRKYAGIDFYKQSYKIDFIKKELEKGHYGLIDLPYGLYLGGQTKISYNKYKKEIGHCGTVIDINKEYITVYNSFTGKNVKINTKLLLNSYGELIIPVSYFRLV